MPSAEPTHPDAIDPHRLVPDWTPRPVPRPQVFEGRHARLEPLAPGHAADLHAAFAADTTGHLWDWMAYGPFADAAAYANNASQGFNDIAPYPLYPGFHSIPVFEFAINKKVWDSLDKASQTALEVWFEAAYNDLRRVAHIEDQNLVRRDAKPGSKVHVIDWPQKDRDEFRKIAVGAWKNFSEKSPLAGEVYQSHMKFLTELGLLRE